MMGWKPSKSFFQLRYTSRADAHNAVSGDGPVSDGVIYTPGGEPYVRRLAAQQDRAGTGVKATRSVCKVVSCCLC